MVAVVLRCSSQQPQLLEMTRKGKWLRSLGLESIAFGFVVMTWMVYGMGVVFNSRWGLMLTTGTFHSITNHLKILFLADCIITTFAL